MNDSPSIPRLYEAVLREHFASCRQMAFLSGPRQVGKTTLAKTFATTFLSWDDPDDRALVLRGPSAVAEAAGLSSASTTPPVIAFDEIHRHPRWKTFIKGFFDKHEADCRVIATGSARMDVYKRGGDSMMGRYFPYRVHPLSVAELLSPAIPGDALVRPPAPLDADRWDALRTFGGFPEPFAARNARFLRKWQRLRFEQLVREDLRDLSRSPDLALVEALARILANRSGTLLSHASLARDLAVAEPTVKRWIALLSSLYFGFLLRPWHRNIETALRKTPKWYLRDWASIADPGQRNETLLACHLLKAVEGWTDLGYGEFALHHLRDKQKREVDFLVTRDGAPWFLAEAKTSDARLSPALAHYQRLTGAAHAFQVVFDAPYVEADCFSRTAPVAVPALTFLSQLV